MIRPALTIIRGFPGSGKSTRAKALGCFHVEADMNCIHNGIYEWKEDTVMAGIDFRYKIVESAMKFGCDIVVTGTFPTLSELNVFIDLGKSYGYKVNICKCVDSFDSIHRPPIDFIQKLRDTWEDVEGERIIET